MATIPLWLTPVNGPFSCTLTPQTVNASTGVLSDGSAVTVTAELDDDGIDLETASELRNIKALNALRANNVIVEVSTKITLRALLKSAGTNNLASQAVASDYFKVVLTRGAQAWTFYGVRESYRERISNEKSVGELVLAMVDSGAANPGYA